MSKKTTAIYNALSANGDFKGSEQDFNKKFFAPGKAGYEYRKGVYDTLHKGGADVGSSYEEFGQLIGLRATPRQQAQQTPQPQAIQKPKPTTKTPMSDAEKQAMIGSAADMVAQTGQQIAQTGRAIEHAKRHTGLDVRTPKLGQNRNVDKVQDPVSGKAQYETEDGQVYDNEAYATQAQNEYDQAKQHAGESELNRELREAKQQQADLEEALRKRREELDNGGKGFFGKMLESAAQATRPDVAMHHNNVADYEQDEEYGQLMAAIRQNRGAIQVLEDKKNNKMNSFWHSFATTAANGYTFGDGRAELNDAIALTNAQKRLAQINAKRERGEMLTREEESAEQVLTAALRNQAMQGKYGDEYGGWAIAGAGAPVSLDMMKNMLLGGGIFQDVSKGVAKGIAKAGLRQVAKASTKGLLKGAARTAAKGLVKATGVTLGSLAGGALVTNTTGLTKTLGEAAKGATGNVGLDKHGHFQFENQKGLMSALAEAERSQIGENASEMFGEFIPEIGIGKLAIRGLEKIGLSKMAGFLTSMGGKQWAKQYAQVLRASGFNGMPNEALEEYAGILYNQLTGDGDNGLKTLADLRTHRDIWLGTATVGALMGAPNVVMAGAGAAQYYRYKHAMERAAKVAGYRLTEEKWKPLQEAIDNTPNEKMTDLLMDIYGRKDLEMPEKKAAYDYIHNLMKYRGYNVGTINFNDSRKAEGDPKQDADMAIEEKADAAYTDGYNAQGVDMARAKREYDTATKRLIELLGGDAVDALSEEPVLALKRLHNDGALEDDAVRDAATAFVNAKMKFDGVVQRAKDDLDGLITDARNAVEQRTHQDGAIHPVTLKDDDKRAYVVDGNIAMLDDGTTIDTQNSDDTIIVRGEDGKLEFTSPSAIMSVGDLIDPNEERKMAEQAITQDFGTRRAAEIDGIDENGQPIPPGDEEVQAQAQQGEAVPTEQQVQAEEPQQQTAATEEQQTQEAQQVQTEGNAGADEMPMVTNKDGEQEPDFMATTPQRAHQYIYDEAELPREVADEFVANNAKAAQAELDKIRKKQPKVGTSIAKYKAEQAAHQEQLNAAEAAVKYWAEVRATQDAIDRQKREEMLAKQAEATAKAEEEEKERQAQETAKRKEQEERGAGNPHAKVREKWDNAPKVMGVEDELTLPNGEKVKGRYVLVESGAATPSHDATREFAKSEGFPVDENGQSVNDRDYERDQDAQEVTRNIAANYDGRALQNPVVVSTDGVVLSGNGRTMAGELAARDDTDGAYVGHLAKYPQKYGFTEEQVRGMRHPRVVFMADEAMPYTAETFAKFNQQEMKGQSKTEQSVKMGKVVPNDVFNRIIKGINGYDTLAEFYADTNAARDAILELQGAGVITQAQMAEMFDGDGISAQGRELLENMLIGKAFEGNPDAVRQLAEYKGMRQSVITALAEIANNKAMGEDYDLGAEIAAAISLAYQARKAGFKAGEKVSSYARQMNLFTFDDGETVADYTNATMLMLADVLNDNRTTALKRILSVYNHRAADQANGQLDLFAGGIKSKEDIINEVKQLIYDGTEQEQQAAIDRAVESRKESVQQDGTDERGDEGSEPERGGEVDETSRAARGVDGTLEESGARDNGGNAGEQATEPTAKGVEKPTQRTGRIKETEQVDLFGQAERIAEEDAERRKGKNLDKKTAEEIKMAEDETDTNPTEAQKESGNYRKGHVRIDGMEISIEQPKGSVRRGTDAKGNKWESKMHNTYGYIRGTQSVDGDHIDVFLSDAPLHGMVYVVDQVDPETGEFDEHKVMYGFESEDAARKAYLSNYEKGWKGLGAITEVSREDFKEWVQSSKRKTKPFAEYKSVKASKETKGGDTSAANAVLSQKDYVQKRLSEDLANTPYKTLEEWETADIEGYSEQYDNMIAEYPSYLRELAKSEKLQEIYDRSSVKEQKKIREHLEDADIDYKEVLNTSPQRTRVQDRITEEIKYAKGVFSDGTTVSGKVVGQTSESVPIEQNGRKYTIKAKDILEQSDEPISVDKAEFQVGRDNLSSTTDEQELATNAVLSLLENAGIPVEVVSEETAVEMIGEDAEMKTPQGTIYGWTIGGKVYLTQDGLNPETPIHEYTHIWAEAMRRKKADGWDSVKALLKDTPVWNEVLNDPNYQDIKDDEDSVASEVLSRISGKENAKRFEEQAKKTLAETRGIEEKAQVANLISNVRRALNKFWNWVGKDLFGIKKFSSIEEVTDRVLYDLVNGTDLGEVKNDEVRFHKGKSEDDTKTLMGVHNITEDKFLKAIKMGGFANPSAAIIDTSKNIHDDYGEISLIMPSSMIDKRTGRNAGTFEGDAWTPMYPTVERQASMVGLKVINDDIKSVPKEMQNSVSNAIIAWEDGDVLLGLEYLYLFQKGKAPRVLTEQRFDADVHKSLDNIMARKDSAYDLTKDEVKELVNLYVQVNYAGNINKFEKKNENQRKKDKATLERAKPNSIRYKMAKENLEDIERYGYVMSSLNRFVNDVQRDKMTQGVVDVNATLNSANDVIKKEKLEDDFNEWLESLDNRYQIKEVIFDGFTPSGNRRYVPNTLENVSKLMKKQGRQSSVGMSTSFHNFAASVMKFNNTLANIKKKKGKLASNYQDIRDFENKWKDVYLELGKKLQPDAGAFDDYGLARLQGAATQKDPQAYLKAEYGITLSDEDTQKLRDLIKAIQEERPAMYFETKFERPVMLEEFAAAVIPSNLDKKARVALQDAGLAIYEYEPGNVEDRKRAVDEAKQENGVLFRQKDNLDEDLKLEDVLVPTSSVRMPRKPRHNIKAYLNGKPVNRNNMLSVAQQLTKGEPFSLDNNTMLREIKSTVDFSDYYDGTIAEFKALPSDGKTVYEQWEELKAKGYEWHKSPLSNSEYLIDKETGDIYRYANHWGSVASCTWELVGAYDDYNYHIAVSNISDFKAKGYGRIAYPNVSYLQALNQSIVNVKDVLNDPTIDIKPKAREFLENILRDREMRRSDLLSDNDSLIDNRNVRKKRAAEPKPREEENQVEHSRETYTENKVREMETAVTDAAAKMNLGNVVVLPSADGLDGQKKRAKGWFDRRTGKITVVLGNHTSVEDAIKTLMHEAVAHYGLRKLFGKDFDTFLDNVYRNAPPSIRRKIVQLVLRNGWDVRVATEEYLASLAEDTDFEQAKESGWFQRVKELFVGMLRRLTERHKLFDISEDELRYVLWRSYENLTGNGGIMGEAQDVVKREKLLGGTRTAGEPNILFRQIDQDKINFDKAIARGKYEHRMREAGFQTVEAMQDSMKSLMELYKAVDEAENVKREVEDIPDSENAYVGENRLSSVNQAELDDYNRRFFKPLLNSIGALARTDEERQDLFDYMMAKHGLERNNVMATREAQKEYEELNQAAADGKGTAPDWDAILAKHRKRDYSGLTTLMRGDEDEIDTATAEQRAKELVERYEEEKGKADIDNLWYDVNAANAEVLWKMYRGGLLSKEAYHEIADMYKYYIPLRGFDEKTSGEEYAYLMGKNSAFTAPMKTAKGRTSKADNPIAQMALMADSAIMQANRNRLVKIPFLNYVTKHPSDLVSVSDMWLEYDEVNDTWKPKFPEISPEDTPEEVERKVDEFEEKMNELSTQQPDKYVRQGEKGNIPYRVLGSDMREHQVIVKRNGKDYVLTINGNPRAAQAINGLTNPDNKSTGAIDRVFDWIAQGNRWLSAAYTTRNPDFVVSNFIRDTFYSNVMVHVKEGRNYATKFHINHAICNPVMIGRLLHKYNNGELDMNNELQRYFYEFMMNGGETGWTSVKNAEQHKSDIKKTLDRGAAGKSVKKIFEGLDHLNRAIENSARFAAFVTSRQMGRQLGRSIYDAKEISVNFNKKGSGSKMLGATGQTWQGNTAAFVSGIGRGLYTFWNASVQGLTNYMRYTHRNPVKGYSLATALFGLGLLIPYVGYLMSGGDDDGNGYYDMPEYVRRSNILIKAGNGWAKIALPQEYRAIYGMGELAMTAMSGQNQMTRGEALLSAAEQLSQVLPIDFMEGGGSWTAAVPTALKPIVEASINRSWTGLPIYRDNPFNKDDPEWAKSYKSVNGELKAVTKWLSDNTGGDDYTGGAIDLNPAQIEYVMKGMLGGYYSFMDKVVKTAKMPFGAQPVEAKDIPFVNRLYVTGDERTKERAINNAYFKFSKEHDHTKKLLRNYEREAKQGSEKYIEKINLMYNEPEYARYLIFEEYSKEINHLGKLRKEVQGDPDATLEIDKQISDLRKEVVNKLREVK